jgi:tetratricopeptide (TPR) repeat protein
MANVDEMRDIGPYRLLNRIGQGGMGEVYRAVRSADFETQVAIKLVKRGMDTDFVLQHFCRERQILAALDHPSIARLLDGGAIDGRPYLVMDYIEGVPITEYAERHALDIDARLRLFRTVCAAVEYAHQRLIVHRDLKPANILVTSSGEPKLLDFGIAKLLENSNDSTVTSLLFMTAECASPEQARGEPVTTASDIYSLGVLLFELLTGDRPYRFSGQAPHEIARVICETEPRRPSAVRPLPADLDNIVLKAMQKDRALRYRSVADLSADIGRFLDGRPVTARPATLAYRAGKFLRRHKAGAAAAAAAAVALTIGVGAALWEAHLAQRRFREVRELTGSLLFELHDAIRPLAGATPVRKLVVARGLKYLDALARDDSGDIDLRRQLASAYGRLGRVQGQDGEANLGDTGGAVRSFLKSVNLWEQVAAATSAIEDRRALAGAYDLLGSAGGAHGLTPDECYRRALAIRKKLVPHLTPLDADKEMRYSYFYLGDLCAARDDLSGALDYFQNYLQACRRLVAAEPTEIHQEDLSLAYKKFGADLIRLHRYDEALPNYETAAQIDEMLIAAHPDDAGIRMNATFAQSDIAYIHWRKHDLPKALQAYRKVQAARERLAAADPQNDRVRGGLVSVYLRISSVLAEMGDLRGAVAYGAKALPRYKPSRSQDSEMLVEVADAYAKLAERSGETVLWRGAKDWYVKAAHLDPAAAQVNEKIARCDAALARP